MGDCNKPSRQFNLADKATFRLPGNPMRGTSQLTALHAIPTIMRRNPVLHLRKTALNRGIRKVLALKRRSSSQSPLMKRLGNLTFQGAHLRGAGEF